MHAGVLPVIGTQEIPLRLSGSITQLSAVLLLSLSCLPSGLFPLFTSLAGFLLWEQRRCSVLGSAWLQLPAPTPFPSPLERCPPLPLPVSSRPLGSERLLPTVPWRDEAGLLGQHPPFSHPLAPIPVPDEASEASLVWAGGSSSPHCLTRIWKLWFP